MEISQSPWPLGIVINMIASSPTRVVVVIKFIVLPLVALLNVCRGVYVIFFEVGRWQYLTANMKHMLLSLLLGKACTRHCNLLFILELCPDLMNTRCERLINTLDDILIACYDRSK